MTGPKAPPPNDNGYARGYLEGFRAGRGGDRGEQAFLDELERGEATVRSVTTERRTVSATGGEKGDKLARFDLIPVGPLWQLAEHYGRGARKYADNNWRQGYPWHLNYAAALRHLASFWGGEDLDPETGSPHVIAAAWHCLALAQFMMDQREYDDRPTTLPRPDAASGGDPRPLPDRDGGGTTT